MKIVIHGKQLPVSFQAEQPRTFWDGVKYFHVSSTCAFVVTEYLFRLLGRIAQRKQRRNALLFTQRRCCELDAPGTDRRSTH